MAGWLAASWFAADVVTVARELIGRRLSVGGTTCAIILETEAYGGPDDSASHAAFRPGGRAALMAAEAGHIYVYAAYGVYPCFNIVTGPVGEASAVLLRSVQIVGTPRSINGPGRTSRALGISLADHGRQVPDARFSVSVDRLPCRIVQTPRIGITRGVDVPWRFVGQVMAGAI
ncbi:MAG: DNA-3-methyladenine glycosylase [Thermomicrobiales bacterium]|nr:DNA-3-methyladenine glycosylase [Thermomicrobiales bacterium]